MFLIFFVLLLFSYAPALNGGFLWDDDGHICPPGLRSLTGLWRIWTELGAAQQYYPILHSAFWLEFKLWGEHAAGYHLLNILLHSISAVLVVGIARRLLLPGACFAGIIFSFHPVCVESVAWITEQKNTLSAVFYLGSLSAYLRFEEDRQPYWRGLAFALFLLALFTKTVTATLPAVLLIIIWWKRGKLEWKRDVSPLTPWFIVGACTGLFTAWIERWVVGAQNTFSLDLLERCLLAGRAAWFYLGKIFWPANLVFIYPRWTISTGSWWQYLYPLCLSVLVLVLWLRRGSNRAPIAAVSIYLVSLFPVLGFLAVYPFVFSFVADHFQYLASLAIIIPSASIIGRIIRQFQPNQQRAVSVAVTIAIAATLGTLTWRQARNYRNAETLYRATLASNPDCWLALNNLGKILAQTPSSVLEAVAHFEAALRIYPDQADTHYNLANALAKLPDRRSEALHHYEETLRINFDQADAHNNYGVLLARDPNRLSEAANQFEIALKINPNFADAHSNLGTLESRFPGRLPEATIHLQTAALLNPLSARVHFDLGNVYAKAGSKKDEAIAEYLTALRIDSSLADAHFNLANVLRGIPHRRAEAIEHYQATLRLRPDWDFARRILNAQLEESKP